MIKDKEECSVDVFSLAVHPPLHFLPLAGPGQGGSRGSILLVYFLELVLGVPEVFPGQLQYIILGTRGLLPAAWNTSTGRGSVGILIRCPNHLNWHLRKEHFLGGFGKYSCLLFFLRRVK